MWSVRAWRLWCQCQIDHYLLGTEFTGLGERHACAVGALQEIAVGGLVALDGRGPVVVGVLGVPRVRPPLQLVAEPLHCPRPLALQIAITLCNAHTHTLRENSLVSGKCCTRNGITTTKEPMKLWLLMEIEMFLFSDRLGGVSVCCACLCMY